MMSPANAPPRSKVAFHRAEASPQSSGFHTHCEAYSWISAGNSWSEPVMMVTW